MRSGQATDASAPFTPNYQPEHIFEIASTLHKVSKS